jgi:hypothetical protein
MSLIKSIMHQLGLSGDPAKNFTLSVPAAPDGTMKLARGNAGATTQDIMTVNAAGKVAFPQNVQTWTSFAVPSVRNLGVTYTNDTGQPIDVNVSAVSTTVATITLTVSGHVIRGSQLSTSGLRASVYARVPAGATYQADLAATASGIIWEELR